MELTTIKATADMSQTRILDASLDQKAWLESLRLLSVENWDIYFRPEYVAMHRFRPDTKALLFTYRRADSVWVYPLLLQPIYEIARRPLNQTWFDIESPYGYGGPSSNTTDPDFVHEAQQAFTQWCQESSVVAEFIRLHPILENERWLDPGVEVSFDRETVSINASGAGTIDLPSGSEARRRVRRGVRSGVRIEELKPSQYFDQFVTLYKKTMDRLTAEEYYYFDDTYFTQLQCLVENDGIMLAAKHEDEWAAAAIFFAGPTWLHYHLGASDPEGHVPGAMNQLLFSATQICDIKGLSRLHLGGGRTTSPDDSLLKFKRIMATDSHRFNVGRRVHNPEAYAQLKGYWEESCPNLVSKYGNRILCYRYDS